MDWDDFERRAGLVIPNQPIKPKRCWIGVLFDNKDPRQHFTELDFIWMIGHSKIPIEKIWETYEARQGISDFHIVARDGVLDKKLVLKDFMDIGSELVVFRAVRAAQQSHATGVNRAPSTPHRITNGASNSTGLSCLSPRSLSFTSRVKREPLQSNETHLIPGSATPPVFASAHVQRTINPSPLHSPPLTTTLASPRVGGGMEQHGRLVPPAPPTPASHLSPLVSPTHPASSPAAAQANSGALGHSTVSSPTMKIESGSNAPAPSVSLAPDILPSQQAVVSAPFAGAPQFGIAGVPSVHQSYLPGREYQPPLELRNEVEEEPSQPFDAGHFFMREPSPEQDTQDGARPTDEAIRDVIKQESPETLEAGVQQSLKVLLDFKQLFASHSASIPDAQAWEQSIDKLIPQAKRKRTVVGVTPVLESRVS